MQQQKAFTLIELLVVIAIIALLMAIMVPVLSGARRQAQGAVCKSNLRQVGLAAHFYTERSDGLIPRGTSTVETTWFQLFMPYLAERPIDNDYRHVKIFRCPSYPNKEQTICFVNNAWEFTDPCDILGHPIDKPTNMFALRRLDSTIYIADNESGSWRDIIRKPSDWGWHMCDVWSVDHLPTNVKPAQARWDGRRIARARHNKGKQRTGCHCLFLDWHVEWVEADKMTVEMWRFRR